MGALGKYFDSIRHAQGTKSSIYVQPSASHEPRLFFDARRIQFGFIPGCILGIYQVSWYLRVLRCSAQCTPCSPLRPSLARTSPSSSAGLIRPWATSLLAVLFSTPDLISFSVYLLFFILQNLVLEGSFLPLMHYVASVALIQNCELFYELFFTTCVLSKDVNPDLMCRYLTQGNSNLPRIQGSHGQIFYTDIFLGNTTIAFKVILHEALFDTSEYCILATPIH